MSGVEDGSAESPQEVLANLPRSRRQRPSARRAAPARAAVPSAPTVSTESPAAPQQRRTIPPAGYAAPDARPGSAHPLTQLEELLRTTLGLLRR